ncbi:MAG: hypothetical protein WC859_09525 [Elusimicrobiota bacterium]
MKEFARYTELKHLAYNLAALQQQTMFRSLAVLSFFSGEGKTLFCATAARAYAEACGTRVLAVDTTTAQNSGSLLLRECFDASDSAVDVTSLEEFRKSSNELPSSAAKKLTTEESLVHEPEIVAGIRISTKFKRGPDHSLIQKLTEDTAKAYGLVLLDTAALNTRNKNNIDPLTVARQADASILIVSRKLLNAADLNACLKIAQDPAIRLVGLISNEEFA